MSGPSAIAAYFLRLYGITIDQNDFAYGEMGWYSTFGPNDFYFYGALTHDWCSALPPRARRNDYIGARILARGGEVWLYLTASGTALSDDVYLLSPGPPRFVTSGTGAVKPINLGAFPTGTELVFGIHVRQTNMDFVTGPGSRNPDGTPHAAVLSSSSDTLLVGFEDVTRGGDRDYDDVQFTLSNVLAEPNREPAPLRFCLDRHRIFRDQKSGQDPTTADFLESHMEMGFVDKEDHHNPPYYWSFHVLAFVDNQLAPRPVKVRLSLQEYMKFQPPSEGAGDPAPAEAEDSVSALGSLAPQGFRVPLIPHGDLARRVRGSEALSITTGPTGFAGFLYLYGREEGLDLLRIEAVDEPDYLPAYMLIGWKDMHSTGQIPVLPSPPPPPGVPVPRTLRFVDPPEPLEVTPSARARTYPDAQGKLHLYPFVTDLHPRRFKLSVRDGDQPPYQPARVRLALTSQDGEAGHEGHPGDRAHGWLLQTGEELSTVRGKPVLKKNLALLAGKAGEPSPESAKSAISASPSLGPLPDAPAQPEETPTVTFSPAAGEVPPTAPLGTMSATQTGESSAALSGEKPAKEPEEIRAVTRDEPAGERKPVYLDLWTDPNGDVSFYYLPPEIAGVETLTAEVLQSPDVAPVSRTVAVKQSGLVELQRSKEIPWVLLRTKHHDRAHAVNAATAERLKSAAMLYVGRQQKDGDLQGWLGALAASGYDFPYNTQRNRIVFQTAEPVFVETASLPWGGMVDMDAAYASPAWGHRDGYDVDLMTRHLALGDPLAATPANALGEPDPSVGNPERNALLKKVQFRRLQLLIAAVKEAGGRFLPAGAAFSEGDHLHVSFGAPPPAPVPTKPASPAPPAPGPVLPGPKGLTPANPNNQLPK